MPEEIKAIVRELLRASRKRNVHGYNPSWSVVANGRDDDFDALFKWLAKEAEKPRSTAQIASEAAAKVLKDPKASKAAKTAAASVLTQSRKE